MAKKKKQDELPEILEEKIIEQTICDTLETNYMPYAMSVIVSRAIPEIDGFKPSHRKLLYTMYKMGLISGARTKSSNVVGQTMKLNPHGDGAIYETMVRLARANEALLVPFVDSKGNFGKQYSRDMAYAAPRYTEVKLETVCAEVFRDIDKNTVDFIDNYDNTTKEPVLLPVAFPNILVNPNTGIAVGMASNICSFNLREVCAGTAAYLKDENADVFEYIKAPDFPTGGTIIYNKETLEEIMSTGRGSFKVRAKYSYDKENSCIEITEIPYSTTIEAIRDKVIDCVKTGKTKEIADIRDETDLKGLKITIDVRKNTNIDMLMAKLFKMTPLEDSFGCNFNVLINSRPVVLGVKDIIAQWSNFRIECVKRGLEYDIKEKSDKLHLLQGLEKILLDIDRAIAIIRTTEAEADVVPNLMKGFDIDKVQAEFVAEIKLRNLNKEYILKRTAEIQKLIDEIDEMKRVLSSDREVKKTIIKQLEEIAKKYGEDRLTDLIGDDEIETVTEDDTIEDYRVKMFFTRENYLKKITLVSLRAASEHKLKDGDEIIEVEEASNKDDILLFTDKGGVYKYRIYDIPDCKASSYGEYLPNLLGMEADERIIYMTTTSKYEGYMIFAFENGKVAKVEMSGYATKTNRRKLTSAYCIKSPLAGIFYIESDSDVTLISKGGRALICSTALIAAKAKRDTQGIQVYLSKRDGKLEKVFPAYLSGFENTHEYVSTRIPSSGQKMKDTDIGFKQISFFDE
ncbi:MAG: DNA gyrase subunit A [Bacillota bacterium]|nr:DNA gyrase subunit A [Bacillota bacterium]